MSLSLENITIEHYRSIEKIELFFPKNKPLILFGPNNAGKSNILSAINRLLGERYPTYIDMLDSDYFQRDKLRYPDANITATFNESFFSDRNGSHSQIAVRYGCKPDDNLLHDGNGKKLYLRSEDRLKYQSYLIDAERNIQSAFNYSSQYSLLSKFSHKVHEALTSENKTELLSAFNQIKSSFEKTVEFSRFFEVFYSTFKNSVKGFVHLLDVDFSAYDPNNYTKSLRIYAKEGDYVRGFEEFGTGEQQVLLMAFVRAYMQIFNSERFILIIEELEAHLHPLIAQKWLKEYLIKMCNEGIQIIISTHSTEFIDAEYIEGLVRVYKINGITQAKQLSAQELCDFCIQSGAPEEKTSPQNIADFYSTKLFDEQLKGVFAETIILVEGATEFLALPIYLRKLNFSLAEHGIEIINCDGKNSIPLFWRLFKAYGYNCYPIFDCDLKPIENEKIFKGLIDCHNWIVSESEFFIGEDYAYFGNNFEAYFQYAVENYNFLRNEISKDFQITSKPGLAKAIAQHSEKVPEFIIELKKQLESLEASS